MRTPDVRAALTSAPLSATLIVINIAVFVAVNVAGRLLDVLALPPTWAGVAGLAGSFAFVATAALTGFNELSVGGSAAFLGLLGALATSPRSSWGARLQIDKVVVVVVLIQLVAPVLDIGDWVSSAAHTTGLAVGGVYGYLLRSRRATQRRKVSVSGR